MNDTVCAVHGAPISGAQRARKFALHEYKVGLPGDLGMRTEVNAVMGSGSVEITPVEIQRELLVL